MAAITLQAELLSGASEIPQAPKVVSSDFLSVTDARERLGEVIESAFTRALEAYGDRQDHWIEVGGALSRYDRQEEQTLVRVTVGTGKTRQTVKQIIRVLLENKHFRVLVRVKDHKMGRELSASIAEAMTVAGLNPNECLVAWHGTDAPDPRPTAQEGDQACLNQERLKEVIEAGGRVSNACNACNGCSFRPDKVGNPNLACYYKQQRAENARVVIAAGDVSLDRLPESLRKRKPTKAQQDLAELAGGKALRPMDFDLIILDETNPTDFVTGQLWIRADCLLASLGEMHLNATGRNPDLKLDKIKSRNERQELLDAPRILADLFAVMEQCAEDKRDMTAADLQAVEICKDSLASANSYVWKHSVEIDGDQLKAFLSPEELSAMLAKAGPVNSVVRSISRILKAAIQGLEDAEKSDSPASPIEHLETYFKTIKGERHLVCVPRRRMEISPHLKTAPVLILDATADEQLLRPWFPALHLAADIKVEDGAGVYRVQLTDRAMSYRELIPNTWEKGEEPSAEQVKDLRAKYRNGGQSADTPAEKEELRLLNKHDSIQSASQKVKDLAALQNFMRAVYGGRVGIVAPKRIVPRLMALGVDQDDLMNFGACRGQNRFEKVRGLIVAGRPSPPVSDCERLAAIIFGEPVEKLDGPFKRAPGSILKRSGVRSMPETEFHPDWRVEAVRRSICEAELIQAIGRARAVNRGAGDPVTIAILTSVPLDTPVDQFVNYDCIDSIVGWPGACVAAGMWPRHRRYGAHPLRAEMIRATAEAMPGYAAAMDLGAISDAELVKHIKNSLRSDALNDRVKTIDDEFDAGGGVDFFGLPLSAERFEHGEAQTMEMRKKCPAMYAGKPQEFTGSRIEGNGWEWKKIECDSSSWTPENEKAQSYLDNTTISYEPVRDQGESHSESNSRELPEKLAECLEKRGFIPMNSGHLAALGVYGSRGAADRALTAARDLEPIEGEVIVSYEWAASRKKAEARALVRAGSIEEAREIVLAQLPGAEIL